MYTNETYITNHKDYTITTSDILKKGIFFRNPVQPITKDTYAEDEFYSAWAYLNKLRGSKVFRIVNILLGNKRVVDNIEEWSKHDNWGGCTVNILASPIYFSRQERTLTAICLNPDCNIQKIESHGYESQYNIINGNCDIEKTTITLKNGKKLHMTRHDTYHFTYEYTISNGIDKGIF